MKPEMKAQSLDALKTLPLSEATAQDIQLELIRRWQYNAFDGERVAAKLWEHRDLWEAVMMDRLADSDPGQLPAMGLIELPDLPTTNATSIHFTSWPRTRKRRRD